MPLPEPTLDNRVFDQLVAEGRGQVPRLAPRWTDHNASDPGITLLELAAWLTEQNVYRFDRPSDEALRAFAALAGATPGPQGVARTVVAMDDPNGLGIDLPARLQFASFAIVGGAPVATPRFESTSALFVSPARLVRVATGRTTLADATQANARTEPYAAFGERPRRGHALTLGFDRPLDAPGRRLALHAWTEQWEHDAATREALVSEFADMLERVMQQCPCGWWQAAAFERDWRQHYRVRTRWEFHAGGGTWLPLAHVEDETRALSLTGFVRFDAPQGHQPVDGTWPIRCRIVSGRFECPPRLRHLSFNATGAEHALTRAERTLGQAHGHAGAVFPLADHAICVVPGSTAVRLVGGGGQVIGGWQEVAEWDRTGPHDRHYRLDAEAGTIESGNGLRGEVMAAGFSVRAAWREGGGAAGNLPAGTLERVPVQAENLALAPALAGLAQPLAIRQPFAATGGAAPESLAACQGRAYRNATRVDKAVTLADFERLALETPGVPVARAFAIPGLYPALPCVPAPGAVTLVIVPPCPRPAPLPSRALLDAVREYLDPRRLVTSEVHVVAPAYRRVGVDATLLVGCEADAAGVLGAAREMLDAYFDPVSGGPDGNGWPVGRPVYRAEILARLASLDGVARVTGFGLRGPGDRAPRCGNVELCPYELVVPGRHRLRAITALPLDLTRSDRHECESC